MEKREKVLIVLLRGGLSLIFLWAFLDKLFGWGFSTTPEASWLAGGSPTTGYLRFATHGPFAPFFQMLAGSTIVDWLFMLGLLGIGVGLLVPKCVRLAAYGGSTMLMLMYLSAFPPEHHPLLDEHIIYILVLMLIADRSARKVL
jgi:thiosulfate dehydrogenase (quinone) large subunit